MSSIFRKTSQVHVGMKRLKFVAPVLIQVWEISLRIWTHLCFLFSSLQMVQTSQTPLWLSCQLSWVTLLMLPSLTLRGSSSSWRMTYLSVVPQIWQTHLFCFSGTSMHWTCSTRKSLNSPSHSCRKLSCA